MRIALAGNPNSGKTTMYNHLTGRNEKVGNWAGVTVDRKEAPIKKAYAGDQELIAVDLPGAYSMSPFTSEESITSSYVKNENPDVIINIVDATNLSRSLFFTTQLLELGIPMVIALNKSDINARKQTVIDATALSLKLGCPVVQTVCTDNDHSDLTELVSLAVSLAGKGQTPPYTQGETDLTDKKSVEAADRRRFAFVNQVVKAVETRKVLTRDHNFQDKIDAVLTHPIVGLPIFAVVMFLVFQISQAWLGEWLANGYEFENGTTIPGLVTLIDLFKEWIAGLLEGANANVFLASLLTEGIIGGVSAVIGFLPLVMVMYFLISLLEDCGYMARATVVLDPIFKKVGLSGKSVIPFIIGTGCAIPGVMAARTIRNERERNATAMLTPFMPCGAKLPVIALFAGAFFDEASWVGTLMYFVGIAVILLGAVLVNRITGSKHRKSYFIIELPEYKAPSLKRACLDMCSRGWAYIVKAGTIILVCNAIVYIMQSFNWSFQLVAEGMESTSILATIANPVAVALVPIVGITAWQLAAGAITGFIAKENVVGTLAVCYGFVVNEDLEMVGAGNDVASAMVGMTKVAALAYLMFNLFSPPCFAALGAMNAEIKDKKWFWGGIALQLGTGYTLGYLVYTVGTLIVDPAALQMGGVIGGGIFVLAFATVLIYLCAKADKKVSSEFAFSGRN
ncbi:MAG: ferrous iron transport protein B [Oscillospiraceae bacterium]|nr:ferrous iron transport protein B [Oscillospiraceae bacterium]